MKKEVKKDNSKVYLFYGILAAIIIFIAILLTQDNSDHEMQPVNQITTWTEEGDSTFVKMCYDKYKTQIKGDPVKQENTKAFCRCMLEKIKTKYSEYQLRRMTDSDIKQWDAECRSQIGNPGNQ